MPYSTSQRSSSTTTLFHVNEIGTGHGAHRFWPRAPCMLRPQCCFGEITERCMLHVDLGSEGTRRLFYRSQTPIFEHPFPSIPTTTYSPPMYTYTSVKKSSNRPRKCSHCGTSKSFIPPIILFPVEVPQGSNTGDTCGCSTTVDESDSTHLAVDN